MAVRLLSRLALAVAAVALVRSVPASAQATDDVDVVSSRTVRSQAGRYFGWPANWGMWSWGDEIVVQYVNGAYTYKEGCGQHDWTADRNYVEQSRSTDGGVTWSHRTTEVWDSEHFGAPPTSSDLTAPIDFSDPDLALQFTFGGYLYYSYDRAATWNGPYRLPSLGSESLELRTDYVVDGSRSLTVFWALADYAPGSPNGSEAYAVRTTDGGLTWTRLGRVSRETNPVESTRPLSVAIMPSSVRVNATTFVSCVRNLDKNQYGRKFSWITCHRSSDNGRSWTEISRPTDDDDGGNTPPALTQLANGDLVLTYGHRVPVCGPTEIRAKVSRDGGETWGSPHVLRGGGGNEDIGYTRNALRPDGKVVTTYYWHVDDRTPRSIAATIWDPGVSPAPTPTEPRLTVSPAALQLPEGAATRSLTLSSNVSWSVSDDRGWLSVSPASGSGDGAVEVRATANPGAARSGTVTITGGGITRTLAVNQAAATPDDGDGDVTQVLDPLDDWSVIHSRTANWSLVSRRAFGSDEYDASVATRSNAEAASLTYEVTDIRDFAVRVYLHFAGSPQVTFATSPDGRAFTPLAATYDGYATEGGWARRDYAPSGALPRGHDYLRITVTGSTAWTPHVSQVEITGGAAEPGDGGDDDVVDPDTWYVLRNRNAGLNMRVNSCGDRPGAKLELYDGVGSCAQWKFVREGDGWLIHNRNGGLDVTDADGGDIVNDRTVAELAAGTGAPFAVVPAATAGYFHLRHLASGLSLRNAECQKINDETPIEFYDGTGSCAQWSLIPASEALAPRSDTEVAEAVSAAYPNPARDVFHLRLADSERDAVVSLVDLRGTSVFEARYPGGATVDLPVSGLPAGLYLAVVRQGGLKSAIRLRVE